MHVDIGILATSPANSAGTCDITVTSPGGTSATSAVGSGPYTNATAYSVIIGTPTLALSPAAGTLPASTVGASYSQAATASNGAAPCSHVVTSGSLPNGLSLRDGRYQIA